MQADAVSLGFLCSVLALKLFVFSTENLFSFKSMCCFIVSAILLMFVIAIYQALVFIPIIIYLILFFNKTFQKEYYLKSELINLLYFSILMIISALFYYISVKLLCPVTNAGYLSSYASGKSNDRFIDFYNLWVDNIRGDMYYGDKTFLAASLATILLLAKFAYEKIHFVVRSISLLLLLIIPFFISFLLQTVLIHQDYMFHQVLFLHS